MADESRILKILLQLQADTAAAQKVTGSLKEIEAQADKTAAALNQGTGDTRDIDWKGVADARVASQAQFNALDKEAIASGQAQVAMQAAIQAQMERRVITELQIEAAEAKLAGDPSLALKLEREAEIRTRALNVQRALNVSTEESIALAQTLVLAEEATVAPTALMGVNLSKAKTEAIVLARELAAGNVRASTMSSLLGSLGTTFTIAGIAAYELFHIIEHLNDLSKELTAEYDKQSKELSDQEVKWERLAESANNFMDVLKLGEQILPTLDAAAKKLDEVLNKKLNVGQKVKDFAGIGSNQEALDQGIEKALAQYQQLLENARGLTSEAKQQVSAYERLQALPLGEAIKQVARNVDELHGKQEKLGADYTAALNEADKLGQQLKENSNFVLERDDRKALQQREADALKNAKQLYEQYVAGGKALEEQKGHLDKLTESQKKLNSETTSFQQKESQAALDAARLRGENVDAAQHALSVEEKISQLKKANAIALKDGSITQAEINALAEREVTNSEKSKEAKQGARDAQRDIVQYLQEESLLLAKNRTTQSAVQQNPFLSVDQKDTLLIPLISSEITQLNAKIEEGQAKLKGGTLDPEQYDKVEKAVVNLKGQVVSLGFDLQKLSFGGGLRAGLVSWVNQFGDSAHQVSQIITGTLNTAIASTSQALTGLIFKTGNWKQTFASAAQSIVANIIQIALQWVISKLVMAAIDKVTGQSSSNAATQAAATAAAAWAPSAISASIASYGAASYTGLGAYAVALGAGEALAIGASAAGGAGGGGYRKGGYTGEGDPDEIAGPVHRKEFVFTEEETRVLGPSFLQSLASAAGGNARFQVAAEGTAPTTITPTSGGGLVLTGGGTRGSDYAPPFNPLPTPDQDSSLPPPADTNPRFDPSPAPTSTTPPGDPIVQTAPNPAWYDHPNHGDGGGRGGGGGGLDNFNTGGYYTFPGDTGPPGWSGPTLPGDTSYRYDPGSGNPYGDFIPRAIPAGGTDIGGGGGGGGGYINSIASGIQVVRVYHSGGLVDDIPSLLTANEFVHRTAAVDKYGRGFMESVNNLRFPVSSARKFAGGGGVDLSGNRGQASNAESNIHLYNIFDRDEVAKLILNTSSGRKILNDFVRGQKLELGIS